MQGIIREIYIVLEICNPADCPLKNTIYQFIFLNEKSLLKCIELAHELFKRVPRVSGDEPQVGLEGESGAKISPRKQG